ncbi:TadE/TadG family type IV pilus assembly protein [Futiania mangrovi]|uniref:Pilus assembly protein n=1 Tax=Futiania mangrovi TaxID=2959716 RepID=A0A9J6PDX9_9PROT|nr:TadE/TadG family type IV pilus assembly protein [Futiania mangrovii]MCP1336865.1 pilus assembly protein [Futiania mangrovii]
MRDRFLKSFRFTAARQAVTRFLRSRDGTVALIFGLTFMPIIAAAGAAFDYSRIARANTVLTTSCDAAALAAGTRFEEPNEVLQAYAQDYIRVNAGGDWAFNAMPQITLLAKEERTLKFRTTAQMDTVLMGLMGVHTVNLQADCEVTREVGGLELVMVLDNSNIMAKKSRLDGLKVAARDLVDTIFSLEGATDSLRVGLVPFSDFVNIRAELPNWQGERLDFAVNTAYSPNDPRYYTGASWAMIDTLGQAPYNGRYIADKRFDPAFVDLNNDGWDDNYPVGKASDDQTLDANRGRNLDNFYFGADNTGAPIVSGGEWVRCDDPKAKKCLRVPVDNTHMALYGRLGIPWKGCVEARPTKIDGQMVNLDILDTPPSQDDPKTLFVPAFTADGNGAGYVSWMSENDEFGDFKVTINKTQYKTVPTSQQDQVYWVNKYYWRDHDATWDADGYDGPSINCAPPVTLLTDRHTDVLAGLDRMGAYFETNIPEGISWGWRMLSPNSPFGDALEYNHEGDRGFVWKKAMIILTAGDNFTKERFYNSYGLHEDEERLKSALNSGGVKQAMDERIKSVCDEIRKAGREKPEDAGIRVYAVAFDMTQGVTKEMFKTCATTPEYFFDAANNDQLLEVFRQIGADLINLRLNR